MFFIEFSLFFHPAKKSGGVSPRLGRTQIFRPAPANNPSLAKQDIGIALWFEYKCFGKLYQDIFNLKNTKPPLSLSGLSYPNGNLSERFLRKKIIQCCTDKSSMKY